VGTRSENEAFIEALIKIGKLKNLKI